MIVVEQLPNGRTLTYSDANKWIRQIETGKEYESAIDYVPHTYEETDMDIDDPDLNDAEAIEILLGGGEA